MSKYDKASLVMIPSAYKAEKLYSVLPENGNGDFTFDRSTTATRVNKDGLIETVAADVPRLDYPLIDGVVQDCPVLLLEPARTNIITYSQDFSQWTASDVTVTDNDSTSPDGSVNASKLVLASGTSVKRLALASMPTTSVARAYSFFVKSDDVSNIQLLHSGDLQGYARFNIEDGSVGSTGSKTTAKIIKYPNGWYRCIALFDSTNAFGSSLYIYVVDSSTGSYGGTASATGDLFVFGAQYEEGTYETSYIKSDSGSSTTRNADVCNSAGTSAEFNDSEGVLYAEVKSNNDSVNRFISVSDGDASDRVSIVILTNDNIYGQVRAGDSEVFFRETSGIDTETYNKIAVSYKSDGTKLFVNGIQVGSTDTSVTMPSGLDTLEFLDGAGNNGFYGSTKEVATFKTALTDTELKALTSWDSFNDMATEQEYSIR
jgi:hypothetical protein